MLYGECAAAGLEDLATLRVPACRSAHVLWLSEFNDRSRHTAT